MILTLLKIGAAKVDMTPAEIELPKSYEGSRPADVRVRDDERHRLALELCAAYVCAG